MFNINRIPVIFPTDPVIYYQSEFGEGHGPPVWSYVHCNGWEDRIHDCAKSVVPNFASCSYNYIAAVTCKESNISVRTILPSLLSVAM